MIKDKKWLLFKYSSMTNYDNYVQKGSVWALDEI